MPPDRRRVGFFRGLHKCQSVKDASSFFASGDPSGVVPHRWRRPCHRSCVRWVRHRARHCYGDGQWARLSVLYFGGAVRSDSDAFAAAKPVTRDTA